MAGEDGLAWFVVRQAVDLRELAGRAVVLRPVERVELLLAAAGVVCVAAEVASVDCVRCWPAEAADEARIVGGALPHLLVVVFLAAIVAHEGFVPTNWTATQASEPALASSLRLAPWQSLLLHRNLGSVKDELLVLTLLVRLLDEIVDRLLDSIVLPLVHHLLVVPAAVHLIGSVSCGVGVDVEIQLGDRDDELVE